MEMDIGGHRGRGAAVPVVSLASGRCRRFKPRELDGFVFASLQDELVVDDVYLRILVRDAERQRELGGDGDARKAAAASSGLGQGLSLPSDLLVRNQAVVVVVASRFVSSPKSMIEDGYMYNVGSEGVICLLRFPVLGVHFARVAWMFSHLFLRSFPLSASVRRFYFVFHTEQYFLVLFRIDLLGGGCTGVCLCVPRRPDASDRGGSSADRHSRPRAILPGRVAVAAGLAWARCGRRAGVVSHARTVGRSAVCL